VTDKGHGIRLIAGLGNPGSAYAETRHNAGAWFIEALCQQFRLPLSPDAKFSARIAEWTFGGKTYALLIPTTYMNHSGQALGAYAKYFQIPVESILIAHDELDLKTGDFRFKIGGEHAGHNGLRDIMHHLHSRDFQRVRLGIDHPGHKDEVSDYVLSKPNKEEKLQIKTAIQGAIAALQKLLIEGLSSKKDQIDGI
jgi:PTH1 family peptidyl-tRNA hydrolase